MSDIRSQFDVGPSLRCLRGVTPIQERLEYGDAVSCEAELGRVEKFASELEGVLKRLSGETKKLSAASSAGNLAALKKARTATLQAGVEAGDLLSKINAFDDEPLSRSVGSRRFLQEIIDAAERIGLSARVSGLSILAFPNRLTVDDKGVKIGRKLVTSVRPSALANMLKADAEKAKDAPRGFIDTLGSAYDVKCPDGSVPVPLSEIYDLLTLLPDAKKSYTEADFVRDLSVIDARGPHHTRDGRQISFPAATSARMSRGFRSVSPSGDEVTYVNIRFVKAT